MTTGWTPQKALAALETAGAALSALALVLMLAATPPFECGSDYESPVPPLHADAIALWCFAAAALGTLVAVGMALASPASSNGRRSALRALGISLAALCIGGGAVFADLARWTCWP
jgi:hypothetical protein